MLEVRNLSKRFGKKWVLNDISLQLNKGHIYGFVGPNGCGKSVLFKVICGFIKADKGAVLYEGKKVGRDMDFLPSLGVLIEKPVFIEEYNQFQNLKYLARIRNEIDDKMIRTCINTVGLDPKNKEKVRNFSLGMRQRLGIAQAIMERPDILILDEPFNGLDRDGRREVSRIINDYVTDDKIVLLTSHIDGDMDQLADKIYEIDDGRIYSVEV